MKTYIVLGDWSEDGHEKYNKVLCDINCTVKEMQEAYKATCKKLGVALDHSTLSNHGGICTEYEDNKISLLDKEILEAAGCPVEDIAEDIDDDDVYMGEDSMVQLVIWFVKYSRPDFECTLLDDEDKIPCFNGFWNKNLNVGIGYGLYW